MINQLESTETPQICLFDSVNPTLADYADDDQIAYLEAKEQIKSWVETVEAEFMRREETYREALRDRTIARTSYPPYARSEEHTSELQSRGHLVCRLLLEKKKKKTTGDTTDRKQNT